MVLEFFVENLDQIKFWAVGREKQNMIAYLASDQNIVIVVNGHGLCLAAADTGLHKSPVPSTARCEQHPSSHCQVT